MRKLPVLARAKRHAHVRSKVIGTPERPRLSVFRSHQNIYAQIINDEKGVTLTALSTAKLGKKKMTKVEVAMELGRELAKQALEKKIKKVVFDRGGYKYHGRVAAVAQGAREGGLQF